MKLSISLENFAYRGILNFSMSESFMAQILEYLMNEFLDGKEARLGGMGVVSFSARKLFVHFFFAESSPPSKFRRIFFLLCSKPYETAWNVLKMSTTDRVIIHCLTRKTNP
jgi:hypothetical protein